MARDFCDDSYKEYEEYEECDEYDEDECIYQDAGNDWTEEDSWDALTGGMYGDMPNNPLEYDAMMDSIGF